MVRGEKLDVSLPERINVASCYLEANLEAGRGDKTAILHRDRTYSFLDLVHLTNRIGNVLRELGVEPENRVLLVLEDSPEWLAAWLATMKIGGVATSAYTFLKPADYEYLLELIRPKVVIADKATLCNLRAAARNGKCPRAFLVAGEEITGLQQGEFSLERMLESADDRLKAEPTHRDDIAYWNFSSGTTGRPKAVPHMHRTPLVSFASMNHYLGFTPDDVVLRVPKLFFHYAREACLFALRSGAAVIVVEEKTTAGLVFDLVRKFRPTVLINVPTMMKAMIDTEQRADLSCLRYNMSSGELLSPQLYHEWVKAFRVEVIDRMGSAETGMAYLSNRPGAVVPGSSGVVTPLTEIRLVDADGAEVPRGEPGLLLARGGACGRFYIRDHEKSNTTFPGNQWVNTGDVFVQDQGDYFWHVGRADQMVKVSGVWVSPLEIEQVLEKCPSVKECAVLGVKDRDALIKVKAYIVVRSNGEASAEEARSEVKRFCKEQLAPHKHPRAIEFLSELPKTGQGKIDRRLLRERTL